LSGDIPPAAVMGVADVFDVVADESTQTDRVEQDKLRVALLSAMDSSAPKVTDERVRSRMERTRTYLNGAYAKGTLVNGPAPELDFTWTTFGGEGAPKRLSDLKGRVVVIDFWATWCGPCVASFPQVRELAARYKDYPVTILGVTSLQGSSTKWENGRPVRPAVDTKGNPDQEYQLMGEFVKALDMTWPVVFSKQEVFNPEYGVKGIPHVVIIDAKGVVRHRGLHPAMDPESKHGKIDALLKEAGLSFPGGGAKPAGQG
jgi:thiol-disulfide isomerase/thioredoxin